MIAVTILLAIRLFFLIRVSGFNNDVIKYAEDTLEKSHGKIVYASVIFRHGDRTIKAHYPSDPHPVSIWPGGILQLTKKGKQQVYDLGKWYRKRYKNLIGNKGYNKTDMVMHSSDTDRALMSAEIFLAAMYPPTLDEMWLDDNLMWQPIPVHTTPSDYDNMIGVAAPCPKYDKEYRLWTSSLEVQKFYRQYETEIKYTCEHANYSSADCSINDVFKAVRRVWTVYNALYIEESVNLKLPEWTKKIYPEPSRTISVFYFFTKTYSLEMRRIKGGPLLRKIISDMQQKRDSKLKQVLHLYSGQETTIAVFLNTLGLFNMMIPNYTASVSVELREKEAEHYVTIFYRNSTDQSPHLLQVPGCDQLCTLNKFVRVTKYLIMNDWGRECLSNSAISVDTIINSKAVIVIVIVLTFVGVIVLIASKCCGTQKFSNIYESI